MGDVLLCGQTRLRDRRSSPSDSFSLVSLAFHRSRSSYRDAVLEPDPKKLAQRIATAEAALAARLRLIEDMAERIAIGHALSALKVLKPVNAMA